MDSSMFGIICFALSFSGAVVASVLGYFDAKKTEADVEFSFKSFFESLLRAAPIMLPAAFALAGAVDDPVKMISAVFAALTVGAGSDVVIKRGWRAVQKAPSVASSVAGSAVAKYTQFKAKLMFVASRR